MTEFGLHFYSSPLDQCPRDVGICVMWDHFRTLEEAPLTFLPVCFSGMTCLLAQLVTVLLHVIQADKGL